MTFKDKDTGTVKLPLVILITILSFVVSVTLAYSTLETKEHSENTYVRKDNYIDNKENMKQQLELMQQTLDRIERKLDNKQDKN